MHGPVPGRGGGGVSRFFMVGATGALAVALVVVVVVGEADAVGATSSGAALAGVTSTWLDALTTAELDPLATPSAAASREPDRSTTTAATMAAAVMPPTTQVATVLWFLRGSPPPVIFASWATCSGR